jgi:diguanylate cyclase (GGDEF)-like protein
LKKYLDSTQAVSKVLPEAGNKDILSVAVNAYRSALQEMGSCSLDACPALGDKLKTNLAKLGENLTGKIAREDFEATDKGVQEELEQWGRDTARHYREKTGEVREILLVMARTAESVGERDMRCAGQLNEVTVRLEGIACLEDLTEIKASIEKNAAELKTSIERMTAEGKAAIDQLRAQVTTYQVKLEEAEEIASKDALTGLRSRLCVETQLERRIEAGNPFCAAIIDIDEFKQVNDGHGHLIGDELLKQFATELTSACRSTDTIGRWGGDEFMVLLDCGIAEATAQTDRVRQWICGNYTVGGEANPKKLKVEASIGLAEHLPGESMRELLARADAAMYENKAATRVATRR